VHVPGFSGSALPKPIVWLGSSLERVREFPSDARKIAGRGLLRLQHGDMPLDWKPMPDIGSGAIEVRIHGETAHRIIVVVKFAEAVYVLHAFEKRARKTAKRDIVLATLRYRNLVRDRTERLSAEG
jgi:phage-related protein